MDHNSHTTAPRPSSAPFESTSSLISVAEIRALCAGFSDFFWFLWAHRIRVLLYSSVVPIGFVVLLGTENYHGWSLSRMVDRSSIVMVEVETAPVDLTRPWKRRDPITSWGAGSIISDQRILTAAHVVNDATHIAVRRADSDDWFDAQVSAVSYELDLAILTVEDTRLFDGATPLELHELQHGDGELVAYGFPGEDAQLEYAVGWISGVLRSDYVISDMHNLKYVVDVPGRPGYSGGPLACRGRMTGMIIEGNEEEGIGYAVPVQVVRHFLDDVRDGHVDGSPAVIGSWQPMQNPQIRDYYGLEKGQTGVLVTSILKPSADKGYLNRGDIIVSIDEHDVANDGSVAVEPNSRVSFEYLFDRKQSGETVTIELLRDGQLTDVYVPLTGPGKIQMRLVPYLYDEMPDYLVVGGFVFTPLTCNYAYEIKSPAIEWPTRRHLYNLTKVLKTPGELRDEVIVLVRLLPDATTDGYSDCFAHVVTSVNGRRIGNMSELSEAFFDAPGDFHRIVLEPDNKEIIISKELLGDRQATILEKYGIPADRNR